MKKVIFLCIMIAVVIILAGVNPTSVDMNVVYGYVCLGMLVIPMSIVAYVIIKDEISDRKENKIRKIKEAEKETLCKKYSHLTKGLTTWINSHTLLHVTWCDYSSDFHINYEDSWNNLCIRGHIHLDGSIEHFHTIGGYQKKFFNAEHEQMFRDAMDILLSRIKDANNL